MDGENGRLAPAQARFRRQHDASHHQPALGGSIRAVVDGGERRLRAGAAVHGIEVVHQALHGLIGRPLGLFLGVGAGERLELLDGLVRNFAGQRGLFRS